jgi:hypothetical protein
MGFGSLFEPVQMMNKKISLYGGDLIVLAGDSQDELFLGSIPPGSRPGSLYPFDQEGTLTGCIIFLRPV